MLTDDFVEFVAQRRQKVLICIPNCAIQIKLDDGLRFAYGFQLPLEIGIPQLAGGDVRCVFDDAEWNPVVIKHRVVGSLNPDFPTAFADALVLT